jgi:hypothetical protein
MRRLVAPVLCAGAIAAPIPAADAQAGPDTRDPTAKLAETQLEKAERAVTRATARLTERRAPRRRAPAPVAVPPHLEAIAQCESGGDPTAVSADGMYHGKYQFSVATWQSVGGAGLPSQAPEAEQDRRAIILYERSGPGQWPVCGR